MKNIYMPALTAMLIAGTVAAQGPTDRALTVKKDRMDPAMIARQLVERNADREVLWSNDFSNPNDWTMGSTTNHYWTIGTQGGQGAYTIGPINSTTADNGFAIYDSDNIGADTYQNTWIQVTNPIDLSGHDLIVLQFEQYYREFQGECFLETSTDGTTWTTLQINDIGGNNSTANPELAFFNISDELGGESEAYFRFRYESNRADYSWMIDDIEIISLPEFDLIMDYGFLAQFGEQPGLGGATEYHRLQQNQLGNTVHVGAGVINYGFGDQTNVQLHISLIDENGTEVASETLDLGTMVSGDEVAADMWMTIPNPLPIGEYTCLFTLSSDNIDDDATPNNNEAVRYMASTTEWYTLDGIDIIPDDDLLLSSMGTNSFTDNTTDVRLLVYYEVHETTTFTGVEIYLANGTDEGSYFIASVYDTLNVWNDMDSPLAESDIRIIDGADMSTGRAYAEFLDPITLQPGGYFAVASLYQEAGNNLRVLDDRTVDQPFAASLLWLANDDDHLYSNGVASAVRLKSYDVTDAVQELPTLEGVTMFPNPTSGAFEVHVTKAGNMTVEVFNTLGALVQTSHFNGTATQLDLTGAAPGVYTVRVGDGSNFNVQRITVK